MYDSFDCGSSNFEQQVTEQMARFVDAAYAIEIRGTDINDEDKVRPNVLLTIFSSVSSILFAMLIGE